MIEKTIEVLEDGAILTVQEEVNNRIISNAYFFNSFTEAEAYALSSFA